MFETEVILLLIAFILDILFADPYWLYHPVQMFGYSAQMAEKFVRKIFGSGKLSGTIFLLLLIFFWSSVILLFDRTLSTLGNFVHVLFLIYLIYSFLAIGSLTREAREILLRLKMNDILGARKKVSGIVSRDMGEANEKEIVRATIESVTENISDGIVAPLFYVVLGGPFAMLIFKLVNTLDSMVGYKNEKYFSFGWASARLDDVLCYIPARITGALIILSALIFGDSLSGAVSAWNRDAQKGPSPNGGIPIVTFAGARNIRLGGPCKVRDGKEANIPFVGGKRDDFTWHEIKVSIAYTYMISLISLFVTIIILGK